jgi:uncharacterized protein (DUF2164 family)
MFAQIKLYLLGGFIVATLIGDVAIGFHYYGKGWNAAVASIAAKDRKANDAADKATANVDACYAGGGTWDAADGVCRH